MDANIAHTVTSFLHNPAQYKQVDKAFSEGTSTAQKEYEEWYKYPHWNKEELHILVKVFYVWLAAYRNDDDMLRLMLKDNTILLSYTYRTLCYMGKKDIADEFADETLRKIHHHGWLKPITEEGVSKLLKDDIYFVNRALNNRGNIPGYRSSSEEYFLSPSYSTMRDHVPTDILITNVKADREIDARWHLGYIYKLKDQWHQSIKDMNINDVTIRPDLRMAKILALGLEVPQTIFTFEGEQARLHERMDLQVPEAVGQLRTLIDKVENIIGKCTWKLTVPGGEEIFCIVSDDYDNASEEDQERVDEEVGDLDAETSRTERFNTSVWYESWISFGLYSNEFEDELKKLDDTETDALFYLVAKEMGIPILQQ